MAGWEELECGDERGGDGFGLLVARFRAGEVVGRAVEECVGERLERPASPRPVGSGASIPAATSSRACRRPAARRRLRRRFVAIRCSRVRGEARCSNPADPCQADGSGSCRASCASWIEPGIR